MRRIVDRRRHHRRAPRLHQHPAVRLLLVRRAHHVDLALEVELRARERQRRAPLAGAGLGRETRRARPACCSTPAPPRCSACANPRATPTRPCSRCAPACRAPASSRSARTSGVGRHSRRMSSTGPGMSIDGAPVISCSMSAIGNSGARSSGPTGSFVPGCSGGCIGSGRSGSALYQAVGILSWASTKRVSITTSGSRARPRGRAPSCEGSSARTSASPTSTASNPTAPSRAASAGVRTADSATRDRRRGDARRRATRRRRGPP